MFNKIKSILFDIAVVQEVSVTISLRNEAAQTHPFTPGNFSMVIVNAGSRITFLAGGLVVSAVKDASKIMECSPYPLG